MRKKASIFLFLVCFIYLHGSAQTDSITISGIVSDFDGQPVDSALVEVKHSNFKTAYETLTDSKGHYSLKVSKGKYFALASLKMSEYPVAGSILPKDDQRLEFWAWNLIAEEDMILNIKYHRLEVYGVNVFRIQGAHPGYTIYCRPMSLTRGFSEPDKNLDFIDLCPPPEDLEVRVKINGHPVKVNMKEKVKEYVSNGICYGYLLHVDLPSEQANKNYNIFHIEMTDLKNGDQGEAVYFKRKDDYE
ncbi:carboxypeptidase-like regulatory domain-containing protein [Marinifilum sp. D714]|uniref:carboxypeptidase-like regulatory domain-containing protein n=1 Tax=Marinifilum sp. D714 TaxID=2937523 RepID=UPI0027CD33B6|nr:carboxypeptidase-like regulatory domain-containing protein [Marinifilum sp. D714]MDQ2180803.1 carboxypeptidase-like regulatory domain-containing protein [Marinifilum sp. D714]